jgi:hypothetical protein
MTGELRAAADEYVKCPTCTGAGCQWCRYEGQIESAENWCRGCDGVGCNDCNGTGEYRPGSK